MKATSGTSLTWWVSGAVVGAALMYAGVTMTGGKTTLNDDCVTSFARGVGPDGTSWTRTERVCD